ncbi:hypothetical protein [Paenibacillus tianjinensis]|uniref:Uncharacterized protein n=1 Tax=Paenibacillus tianjinensis TaxID=2810347 RepID=A0ABX7L7Q5_9BACL|nr:hypothetical protein [Paenibacillus tianjinensis]QSF42718.1 hypothetical protein JRJ22_15495 [Paenibacillus tianjinensis]
MNATYKVLVTDADLFTAALAEANIYVVQMLEGQPHVIADYAGPLQKWTPDYIMLAGMAYKRSEYEFRVRLPKK